ncbi:MAG: FAD/NAD(P)-binding protein, partial [Myxococcota bacterium]
MNCEWLIVGGGIHGVHIAARLIGEAGVCWEKLHIVDPGGHLLSRWRKYTFATGMTHLRSPSVHHLDLHPLSLRHFARKRKVRTSGLFAWPCERPALSLFDTHCDQVINHFALSSLHIQERVVQCCVECHGVCVQLSHGDKVHTKNVVLAIGASDQPEWPGWAPRNNTRVQHIFDPGFEGCSCSDETVIVV